MRILWWSNAPWAKTGYGEQTRQTVSRLIEAGHEVACLSNYGLRGSALIWQGITVYPAVEHWSGIEMLKPALKHTEADLLISLYDVWAIPPEARGIIKCPWAAMIPVDGTPVPDEIVKCAAFVDFPIAFSYFGIGRFEDMHVDADYIPLGVDCSVFKPGDKRAAREEIGLPQDAFVVAVVATNKGFPCRKSWHELIPAFAHFQKKHPDAVLYLHTTLRPKKAGAQIDKLIQESDIPRSALAFPDAGELEIGVQQETVAQIFRAADVLLNPAKGEGFGLPIVEAQACGTPVITQRFSSMTELTINGIAIEPGPKEPVGATVPSMSYYWRRADEGRIVEALEAIYDRDDETRERNNRKGTAAIKDRYDWPVVMQTYWQPFLERVGRLTEVSHSHRHVWSTLTMKKSHVGQYCIPCQEPGCPAQIVGFANAPTYTLINGFDLHDIAGIDLSMVEDVKNGGGVAKIVGREIKHSYGLHRLPTGLRDGAIVIDVGANIGLVSIWLAKYFNQIGAIYAIEPSPEIFDLLKQNIEAAGVSEIVTPLQLAITSDGRDVILRTDGINSGGQSEFWGEDKEIVCVSPSVTLGGLLADLGIDKIDLLKLDCEGAEYEILGDGFDWDSVAMLLCEIHKLPGGESAEDLAATCKEKLGDRARLIFGNLA